MLYFLDLGTSSKKKCARQDLDLQPSVVLLDYTTTPTALAG